VHHNIIYENEQQDATVRATFLLIIRSI